VARFANLLQLVPLYRDQESPPVALRAAQSTWPAFSSAQLGAEYRAALTLVGVLHAPPLRTVTSRPPLAAVAEQYTLPAPSLVQLGSELTVPAKLFHVPTLSR